MKNAFFFIFTLIKPQLLFQNSMTIFLRIFFEVFHISVGQKIKILEISPDFLTFSAKMQNRFLKSSNFELQTRYIPQNNSQKNRYNSHV